ncbi:MAG: Gfo/Idh/MocA family oxidoreductase [Gammaproteobacteria bacterium]|nr:Gfo/Idh/MocA family oxidoreductase [Gammaproteobacteria bacterium]
MKPIVGLIGCGRWGKHILRDLLALDAVVHVVCLNDATIKDAVGGGAKTAGLSLPDDVAFDAFVVATPSSTHAQVLEDLLDFAKPIFVEKPLTADIHSARTLVEKASELVFVMDKWRYHNAINKIRDLKLDGILGEVLAIKTERWQWSHPHKDVSALWILAPHDLSIAMHILGFIPPVKSAVSIVPQQPGLGVSAILGEDSGPQIYIDIGIASPGYARRFLVVGSEATAEISGAYTEEITLRVGPPGTADAVEKKIKIDVNMPLFDELESFIKFVQGEGYEPMSSAEEGLLVVERLSEIEQLTQNG